MLEAVGRGGLPLSVRVHVTFWVSQHGFAKHAVMTPTPTPHKPAMDEGYRIRHSGTWVCSCLLASGCHYIDMSSIISYFTINTALGMETETF